MALRCRYLPKRSSACPLNSVLRELIAPFHERGYLVVLFNSRGVGSSTEWPSLSGLAEAEDLKHLVELLAGEQLREGCRLERIVLLVGISPPPSSLSTREEN